MKVSMYRIRCLTGLVAASAAAWACSDVDRNADVRVEGTLQRADGSPATSVRTVLVRIPDPLEMLGQGLAVVGTVGTACLAEQPPPLCNTLRSSKTDSQGAYAYAMKGADVQGTFGQVSLFSFMAGLPAPTGAVAGPSVEIPNFVIQKAQLELPQLKFWEPANVSVTRGTTEVTVGWDGFSASHGKEPTLGHVISFSNEQGEIWSQGARSGDAVDARALEDTAGLVTVTAVEKAGDGDFVDGEEIHLRYNSKGMRYTANVDAVPRSRGKACWLAGREGPVALASCPLTNGHFGDSFQPAESCQQDTGGCTANQYVYVDLGSSQPVETIFIHGLAVSGPVALETSDDAASWSTRTSFTATERHRAVEMPAGTLTRYVRLRATDEKGTLLGLTELSVW